MVTCGGRRTSAKEVDHLLLGDRAKCDPLCGIEQRGVALDEQSLHQMLFGACRNQAHRGVYVDHRLQHSRQAGVEIRHGLELVEHQGCWGPSGELGEQVEDVGHDGVELPAHQSSAEGELWPAVVVELDARAESQATEELRYGLVPTMPPATGDAEGPGGKCAGEAGRVTAAKHIDVDDRRFLLRQFCLGPQQD